MKRTGLVVLYARVSTTRQGESGLGLEAQLDACRLNARAREAQWGPNVITVTDVVSGAVQPDDRDGLGPALQRLDYDGGVLVATELDRLSRKLLHALELFERAGKAGWSVVLVHQGIDSSTIAGEFMLQIFGAVAEMRRKEIAATTARAMQAAKRRGRRLGRPVEHSDEARARVLELYSGNPSIRGTARAMNEEGWPTARGGNWHPSTIRSILQSHRLDREAEAARETAT